MCPTLYVYTAIIIHLLIPPYSVINKISPRAQQTDMSLNPAPADGHTVKPPNECFWSFGLSYGPHADQWVQILVACTGLPISGQFCSNRSRKMHRCWDTGMEQTDRRTDRRTDCSIVLCAPYGSVIMRKKHYQNYEITQKICITGFVPPPSSHLRTPLMCGVFCRKCRM